MRIKRIETFTRDPICIVKVTTDDGAAGFGQTAPFNANIAAMVLHQQIARHALGADATDIAGLAQRCIEAEYKFPWSYVCRATCGIETALWDLHGRLEGKSVCEFIGGKPRPVPVYGSSMRRDIKPQDEADRLARLRDAKGFRAFKIRVGKVCGHDQDQWPGRTEALVPTVRKGVGDDVRLLADGNSCYTPKRAIEVGRLLEEHRFSHFEEPCPYWELEWTQEVTAALDIAVAGGEQDTDLAQWRRMIKMKAVDIVQPDVCYIGGLSRALRVAQMAGEAGLSCVPHSANVSMVSVFTLHLLAGIPNAGPHMEFSIEPSAWAEGVYVPRLEVRDGQVAVPEGPGWGVSVQDAWLEKAERRVSERA